MKKQPLQRYLNDLPQGIFHIFSFSYSFFVCFCNFLPSLEQELPRGDAATVPAARGGGEAGQYCPGRAA